MSFRLRQPYRRIILMILTGLVGMIVIRWYFPSDTEIDSRPTWWLLRDAANSYAPIGYSDYDLAMRKKGEAAIPDLLAALDKKDTRLEDIYASIYAHLPQELQVRIPPPVHAADVHRIASLHLAGFSTHAKRVVPNLMNETLSTNFNQRQSAIRALGAIGPVAIDARARLVRLLQDYDPRTRVMAAGALANVDPDAHEAVDILIDGLTSTNSQIRGLAMDFFGPSQRFEHIFTPAVLQVLDSTNTSVLTFLVGQMNRDTRASLLPVFLTALNSERPITVIQAIAALELYGPSAHAAIPTMLMLSGNPGLKAVTGRALGEIGNPTTEEIPGIVGVLRSTNEMARFNAVEMLGYLPIRSLDARSLGLELSDLLDDPNPKVRVFAARALWKTDGEVDAPYKILTDSLDSTDPQIQRYAWLILKEMAASDPLIKVSSSRPE